MGGGIRVRLLRPAEPSRVLDDPAGIRPPGGRRGLLPGGGVVGRAIAGRMRAGLVAGASAMACPPIRGVTVLHSGRGARCTSAEYAKFMTGRGVLPSVGRAGSCCGSAVAESFNAILKKELVNREVHSTRDHAIRDVTARTGSRCDRRRLHSAIDHRTPDQVDTEWRQQHKAAA